MSPLRRHIPIIATFIIGVLVSLTVFVIVRHWEQKHQRIEFESRARGYAYTIQGNLGEYLETLSSMGDYFNNSRQVTRQEFATFADSVLSRHPGIQAFSWNPLVMANERAVYESLARKEGLKNFRFTEKTEDGALIDAAQRQEYVVVYYLTPLETNNPALGYDSASDTTRRQAIDQSFKTGELGFTSRVELLTEPGEQSGCLVFFPVYQRGVSLKTSEARLKYRKGLLVEVLRIGDVLETALKNFPDEGINIYLYDTSAKKGNRLLYAHPSRIWGLAEQPMDEEAIQKGIHWSSNFEFAGDQWEILFSPSPLFFDSTSSWHSWVILSGLLLLTVLLLFHLFKRAYYTAEIEWRAKGQLQTNENLTNEIAERNRAEEALRKSEEFYRSIIENALEIVVIVDEKSTVTYASPSIERILGYKKEEVIGKSILDFIVPADFPRAVADLDNAMQTKGSVVPDSFGIRLKDGSECILEGVGRNLFANPEVAGFVMNVRDVTESKLAEEELSRKTALLEAQLEATIDGILVVDAEGKTILINQKLIDMLKIPQHILDDHGTASLGQYVVGSIQNPEQFLKKINYLYDHPNETSRDEIELKDGVFMDRYSAPVLDKEGKYYGRIWTIRDISKRRRAEEKLRQSEERFRGIFENAIEGIFQTRTDGRFVSANPSLARILGASTPEALTENPTLRVTQFYFDPRQREKLFGILLEQRREVRDFQTQFKRLDGSVVWVSINANLNRSPGGEPLVEGTIEDISARKEAEKEFYRAIENLSASNHRLLAINQAGFILRETYTIKDAYRLAGEVFEEIKYGAGALLRYRGDELFVEKFFVTPAQRQAAEKIIGKGILNITLSAETLKPYSIIEQDKPLLIKDPRMLLVEVLPFVEDKGIDELIEILDFRQLIIAPLKVREKAIGYFLVWSQAFQEWDFQTISAISHQLSISIDNIELIATIRSQTEQLRNLSAKLIQVQEQNLKNISRELHDEVGQALTAVAINLGTIKSNKSQVLTEETVERLGESLLITENVLTQVREISHNLHPSILEDLGMVSALRWAVGRYRNRTGIKIGLEIIAVIENPNPEIALSCYRVVQEALTNVAKHAQATSVQICLKEEGHTLSCIIEDNGNGYDQEAEAAGDYHVRGIGLISMRERISSIGGHLSVQSQPGQGTTISFQIPLKEEIA